MYDFLFPGWATCCSLGLVLHSLSWGPALATLSSGWIRVMIYGLKVVGFIGNVVLLIALIIIAGSNGRCTGKICFYRRANNVKPSWWTSELKRIQPLQCNMSDHQMILSVNIIGTTKLPSLTRPVDLFINSFCLLFVVCCRGNVLLKYIWGPNTDFNNLIYIRHIPH